MEYTLRDMMQTLPFEDLQIIAGREGLDHPVQYVGVLEAPDSINFVRENEFILTTGYVFSSGGQQLADMITKLHERGAAALGIKMFRYIQALPPEAARLADEYRLPVFFIPNKYSWHELILPLILNISAVNSGEGGFFQDYDQLIYAMQHSQTFYDFISRAGELLQKPLALYNKNTGEGLRYPGDYRFREEAGDGQELLQLLADEKAVAFCSGPIRYYRPEKKRPGFMAVELAMTEYQYLILWDSPDPGDLNLFNYMVYSLVLVSDSIQGRRTAQKNQALKRGLVLEQLFTGREMEVSENNWRYFPKIKTLVYAPAMVLFGSGDGGIEERINLYNPVVVRLLEQLHQKWEIYGFCSQKGELCLLIPLGEEGSALDYLSRSRKMCSGIYKIIDSYFPDLNIRLFAGRSARGIKGLRTRLQELEYAMKEKAAAGDVVHIRDLGIGLLLAQPAVRKLLPDFLGEYFGGLEELEASAREKLLEAAEAYTLGGFNTREASRVLGVHHNTIRNRLEQLMTLTGLDLSQSGDMLLLLFYLESREK